jgi:hypothetical protein
VIWRLLSDDLAQKVWDRYLIGFDGFTFHQSYAWGEHRKRSGWTPYRWIARRSGEEAVAMAQILVRSYRLGVGMAWCPGGPVGDVSTWDDRFRAAILASTGSRHMYFRFFSTKEATPDAQAALEKQGWAQCPFKLRSGLSMKLDLSREPDEIRKGLSRNWRRNLRAFSGSNASVSRWKTPEVDEIMAIYRSMESYKGLNQQYSSAEVTDLFRQFGDNLILYRCVNEQGDTVVFRGCIMMDRFAWDLFAATSTAGRGLPGASNACMWQLLQHCRQEGVREYDLMGIDPDNNPGVYRFKRETGGEVFEYLGEWEWATDRVTRWTAETAARWLHRRF